MSRIHATASPRPDEAAMSGALADASPRPIPASDEMAGPAAYDTRPPRSPYDRPPPSGFDHGPPPASFDYRPPPSSFDHRPPPSSFDNRPPPSPYTTGADPFRPQRASHQHDLLAPPPPMTPMLSTPAPDLKTARVTSHAAVRELVDLVRRREGAPPGSTISADIDSKIRAQGAVVLGDLRMLRGELKEVARGREGHRWRKWIIGGAVTTFIPAVRTLFRRVVPSPSATDDSRQASNDTEYAFRRSKSLLSRIRASILGRGGLLAGLTFFVFAALYVFQNEVALRVARTLSRRVRKLVGKVERGGYEVDEKDLGALEGWRWRVLLWG